MKKFSGARAQRGATLVVGLIMLVLITLVITSAFMVSNSNLKAVGNMQFRDEVVAAANAAIEEVISSDFTTLPVAKPVSVDIDKDDTIDYTVEVSAPVCVKAVPVAGDLVNLSGVNSNVPSSSDYNTVWDIVAVVNSTSTGASVTVRQGVRKRLTQPMYEASTCV